jgi:hypothetical protein
MKTLWDNTYKNTEVSKIIKEYSRKMYWRKKEYVDMELEARMGIIREEEPLSSSIPQTDPSTLSA